MIADRLAELVMEMDRRYQELDRGDVAEGEHPHVAVFTDEWPGLVQAVDRVKEDLRALLFLTT